jgi:hypothetical protein
MTPSKKIFEEIKAATIDIWNEYSDEFGYRTEKLKYVNSVKNEGINVMAFYRMFDFNNQAKLRKKLSKESLEYIDKN